MNAIVEASKALLQSGKAKVVIGIEPGTGGSARPLFARTAEQVEHLDADAALARNLATYLTRAEVKKLGQAAVVAGPATLRSVLQLVAEHQLAESDLLAVTPKDGAVLSLTSVEAIEAHLASIPDHLSEADRAALDRLSAMSVEERSAFWAAELSRCLKCYACRASCPMCYCGRCAMDANRPQWVPVASHALGNLEYHVVRAMHLAGRCVQCGSCGAACPVGIPVHLLTFFAEETVRREFGQRAGAVAKSGYALSTFRPDDQESFIR